MTTQETQDTDRLSKLEGAYEQMNQRFNDLRADVNERFNELARGQAALRAEVGSLKTTIIVVGGAMWASTVGGFIALFLAM